MIRLPKLIVILGPTASGKTSMAIKLANKFDGEIISADSRQIYKEMVIGTASPFLKIQNSKLKVQNVNAKLKIKEKRKPILIEGIPHYLVHIIRPNQGFNVVIYKKMALKTIRDIQKRRKLPFLVGGTGLYIKAVIENINFPKIPAKKNLRKSLEKKSEKELFKIYRKLDPKGAKLIDRKNKRRLIRAIEVSKITGKPFWEQRKKGSPIFDALILGIKLPKKELEKRVKIRIEKMFKLGLENEVKNLVKKYGWNISPLQSIGYQEWKDYLKKKDGREELKNEIILHTTQFAKRQMTWFKKEKRINWIKNYKKAEKLIERFLK